MITQFEIKTCRKTAEIIEGHFRSGIARSYSFTVDKIIHGELFSNIHFSAKSDQGICPGQILYLGIYTGIKK